MDFALSSSTVLGAAVLVWLLWVAPQMVRRARPANEGASLLGDSADGDGGAAASPAAPLVLHREADPSPTRSDPLRTVAPSASQSPEEGKHVTEKTSVPGTFRIRWGRCILAGIGLVGLLGALVVGVLAVFGVVAGWIPVPALAVTASSVAVLRQLALRDRRRRVDVAFRAAMRERAEVERAPSTAPPRRTATEVFDLKPEPEPAPAPLSHDELRAAALEVARAAQATAAEAVTRDGGSAAAEWEPVDLPKPAYVESARAEREAPEPLEAPEQPKPTSKVTIKPKPETSPAPGVPTVPAARPAARGALGNLDAVLQRRRA